MNDDISFLESAVSFFSSSYSLVSKELEQKKKTRILKCFLDLEQCTLVNTSIELFFIAMLIFILSVLKNQYILYAMHK